MPNKKSVQMLCSFLKKKFEKKMSNLQIGRRYQILVGATPLKTIPAMLLNPSRRPHILQASSI